VDSEHKLYVQEYTRRSWYGGIGVQVVPSSDPACTQVKADESGRRTRFFMVCSPREIFGSMPMDFYEVCMEENVKQADGSTLNSL
jgi:hypothetical protein